MTQLFFTTHASKETWLAWKCGFNIIDIDKVKSNRSDLLNEDWDILFNSFQNSGKDTYKKIQRFGIRFSITLSLSTFLQMSIFPYFFDFIRIKMPKSAFKRMDGITELKQIKEKIQKYHTKQRSILMIIDDDISYVENWKKKISLIKQNRISGLFLKRDLALPNSLTQNNAEINPGYFINTILRTGLSLGFSGEIELPDIPRLLIYHPNFLGFSKKKMIFLNIEKNKKDNFFCQTMHRIRSLVPYSHVKKSSIITTKQQRNMRKIKNKLCFDRLLVSDFILPVFVGIYAKERKFQQRVCFNIVIDVERISTYTDPKTIDHVFSYDVILDGIRNIVSLGHIDLVETLAEKVADFLLSFLHVKRVMVRVEKLDLAPRAIGVEITRETASFKT